MAHENLKQHLYGEPGKRFVAEMTHKVYDWSVKVPSQYFEYRIFEELTVRYATSETTRIGLDRYEHFRFDCVFCIKPGMRSLNQRQMYTVGVELKNSASDLKYDVKIQYYLGWTDYFMIGVPAELSDEARKKIDSLSAAYPETKGKIGLMYVDTGEVVILPHRQYPKSSHTIDIQNQIIYNCIFGDIKALHLTLEDIRIEPVELRDEYMECTPSTGAAPASEVAETVAETGAGTRTDKNPKNQGGELARLDAETQAAKAAAKQQRIENAARDAERLARLAERAAGLPATVAVTYNKLKPSAKEVFWAVVDGNEHRGNIAEATGLSIPSVARTLDGLQKSGLLVREGSRKTGGYVVGVTTDKSNSCETCAMKDSCGYRGASEGKCENHS